ncbi:MAG: LysE family transporter [Chromatiales bacterium]|nr:LysE family transporter [Chromatiales bacterium]
MSESFTAFLAISFLLIVVPGPSVLLIVSTSLLRGLRAGLLTVLGTSVGMLLPLAATVAGIGALAQLAAGWLPLWRWAGVAWLATAGLLALLRAPRGADPAPGPAGTAFWRGFVVSLTNPATTPFFLAFLPQFVDPSLPALPQLLVLAASFLLLALLLDTLYALLSARLGHLLSGERSRAWRQRLSGGFLLVAALLLALARPAG